MRAELYLNLQRTVQKAQVKKAVTKTSKKAYANARQAKNKVKKAVAKTRVEANNSTRKAGTQLNKKKRVLKRSVNKTRK